MMVRRIRVSYEQDAHDAEQFRLQQAEQMLREAGFVEQADGTWVPEDEL